MTRRARLSRRRTTTGRPGRSEWLDVDWPQHLRSDDVHGARVNYVEMGEGPPVVFIHGLAGCWQNWLENIPLFARDHRVIAIDLPGFGESELPQEEISIPGYGRFVDAFLGADRRRARGARRQLDGRLHRRRDRDQPSEPGRESSCWCRPPAGLPLARAREPARADAFRALARRSPPARHRAPRGRRCAGRACAPRCCCTVVRYPSRISPELCYEVASGAGKPGFLDALEAIARLRLPRPPAGDRVPTLIVWGRNDEIVPVEDADEYERLIPGARKVIFEDTGHVPMLERPARFNSWSTSSSRAGLGSVEPVSEPCSAS